MTADWCQPLGDAGFICGTRMREHSRRSEGVKWCFRCRKRCDMQLVVAVPDGLSYYGPTVHIECAGCGSHNGDLFPGWTRSQESLRSWRIDADGNLCKVVSSDA